MPTVSVKMPKTMHDRLKREAMRLRISKSAVLREAFSQRQSAAHKGSLLERARHVVGSIDGPGDLSARSKKMEGYGRSRRP